MSNLGFRLRGLHFRFRVQGLGSPKPQKDVNTFWTVSGGFGLLSYLLLGSRYMLDLEFRVYILYLGYRYLLMYRLGFRGCKCRGSGFGAQAG